MNIKNLFRKRMVEMFNTNTAGGKLQLNSTVSEKMKEALSLWTAMYDNEAPWLRKDVKSRMI